MLQKTMSGAIFVFVLATLIFVLFNILSILNKKIKLYMTYHINYETIILSTISV